MIPGMDPDSVKRMWNRWGKELGYGHCLKCEDSGYWKKYHYTPYMAGRRCFPLCQECWENLTRTQRLPYYAKLMDEWDNDMLNWPEVAEGVLTEAQA